MSLRKTISKDEQLSAGRIISFAPVAQMPSAETIVRNSTPSELGKLPSFYLNFGSFGDSNKTAMAKTVSFSK